jgi:hypothetical protein
VPRDGRRRVWTSSAGESNCAELFHSLSLQAGNCVLNFSQEYLFSKKSKLQISGTGYSYTHMSSEMVLRAVLHPHALRTHARMHGSARATRSKKFENLSRPVEAIVVHPIIQFSLPARFLEQVCGRVARFPLVQYTNWVKMYQTTIECM